MFDRIRRVVSVVRQIRGRDRENNQAFQFLRSNYADHFGTDRLIAVLPRLAQDLYQFAEHTAYEMTKHERPRITRDKRRILAECLLDLELTQAFGQVQTYCGQPELASCYVDAVLAEATGQEAGPEPTEAQYLGEGTCFCRGIAKYAIAKKSSHGVRDREGWLFGKEYSQIVTGDPNDIAYVAGVLPLSIRVRAIGGWLTRYALTGQEPSSDEQDALVRILSDKQGAFESQVLPALEKVEHADPR